MFFTCYWQNFQPALLHNQTQVRHFGPSGLFCNCSLDRNLGLLLYSCFPDKRVMIRIQLDFSDLNLILEVAAQLVCFYTNNTNHG